MLGPCSVQFMYAHMHPVTEFRKSNHIMTNKYFRDPCFQVAHTNDPESTCRHPRYQQMAKWTSLGLYRLYMFLSVFSMVLSFKLYLSISMSPLCALSLAQVSAPQL